MSNISGPVLRYPGAKWRLAEWVVSHMPEHTTYVEPYFGSGAVFFGKPPSANEIINDLDSEVMNLFRVIRNPETAQQLILALELTPWAREELEDAVVLLRGQQVTDPVERARALIVSNWMRLGIKKYTQMTGFKSRFGTSDQFQNPLTTWRKLPERVLWAIDRLQYAQIENRPALEIIRRCNDVDVLLYVDPPYVANRVQGLYKHEMQKPAQHLELLEALQRHAGPVLLSGYHSELYDNELQAWHRVETNARAQDNHPRTEVLWLNPVAWRRLKQAQPTLLEVL